MRAWSGDGAGVTASAARRTGSERIGERHDSEITSAVMQVATLGLGHSLPALHRPAPTG
jgi:hypothetical protein